MCVLVSILIDAWVRSRVVSKRRNTQMSWNGSETKNYFKLQRLGEVSSSKLHLFLSGKDKYDSDI